jgi:hypothetical protein
MKKSLNNQKGFGTPLVMIFSLVVIAISAYVFINQIFVGRNAELQAAHATFEAYYRFRGCTQLVEKTDTYGRCKLSDGKTIKIVLIQGKWYLEGDGPGVW